MIAYKIFFPFLLYTIFFAVKVLSLYNILEHPNFKLLDTTTCGQSILNNRIIGGRISALGEFPFMAQLGFVSRKKADKNDIIYQFICAGSILNKKYVLTSGVCLVNEDLVLAIVRLGEYDTTSAIDCVDDICAPPVQDIAPEKIIQHDNVMRNDIALVRLITSINFNDFARPICLPINSAIYNNINNTVLTATGWGAYNMKNTEKFSRVLLNVNIPLQPLGMCKEFYPEIQFNSGQLCAGSKVGYDSCAGDSGAPLFFLGKLKGFIPQYYLYGISSYGAAYCGSAPAIYTNVISYVEWILDNISP